MKPPGGRSHHERYLDPSGMEWPGTGWTSLPPPKRKKKKHTNCDFKTPFCYTHTHTPYLGLIL
jgi:hypothetical protein